MAGKARKKRKSKKTRAKLKCPECGHVWDYSGSAALDERITCYAREA